MADRGRELPGLALRSRSPHGDRAEPGHGCRGGRRRGPALRRRDPGAQPASAAGAGPAKALLASRSAKDVAEPSSPATPPDMRIAICAALPFADAAVVIEGLSGPGDDIQPHVHGWPWLAGERWPMAIPSFTVRAIDDFGGEHEGRPGSWRGYGAGEGHRDFTLWPAVPAQVSKLRAVVSTLWEAAWADIDLGPRTARAAAKPDQRPECAAKAGYPPPSARQRGPSEPFHSHAAHRSWRHRMDPAAVVTVWLRACGYGSVAGADRSG